MVRAMKEEREVKRSDVQAMDILHLSEEDIRTM
jgi:hypothetical protein